MTQPSGPIVEVSRMVTGGFSRGGGLAVRTGDDVSHCRNRVSRLTAIILIPACLPDAVYCPAPTCLTRPTSKKSPVR